MCTDFKMLEVKVPIIFSSTQGFPLRRDGRYPIFITEEDGWSDRFYK